MQRKFVVLSVFTVLIIIVGVVSYLSWNSLHSSFQVDKDDSSWNIYEAPSDDELSGLHFSYPSELGDPVVRISSQSFLNIGFEDGLQTMSDFRIIFSKETLPDVEFTQWITDSYGYVPNQTNNPLITDDTSVATFTSINGKEALKIENYNSDPDHSLYLIKFDSDSVLMVAMQGAELESAIRDQIVASVEF